MIDFSSGRFIQNRLLSALLALLLIIKLIKVKFLFVIPFLFGVGTAKKLFLKLLLFFIPAFAHIFKLCSSYYTSSHGTKYHHHHHQVRTLPSVARNPSEFPRAGHLLNDPRFRSRIIIITCQCRWRFRITSRITITTMTSSTVTSIRTLTSNTGRTWRS
jgi:hypothetical protein